MLFNRLRRPCHSSIYSFPDLISTIMYNIFGENIENAKQPLVGERRLEIAKAIVETICSFKPLLGEVHDSIAIARLMINETHWPTYRPAEDQSLTIAAPPAD